MISGKTLFAAMLGHPVQQVRTPAVFNDWAASRGIDAVMIALDVSPPQFAPTLAALRGWENCVGAVVTYPYKQQAVAALDSASEEVGIVGAANVIRRGRDGALHGGMTDGKGFVAALRANRFDPRGADVCLIGAGGAGSAIALALIDEGVRRLLVRDIDAERRDSLAAKLGLARSGVDFLTEEPQDFVCRLVVNATPVGMNGDQTHPFPLEQLPQDCFVADIVPSPAETSWLVAARQRGHAIQTGAEMVACQFPAVVAHLLSQPAFIPTLIDQNR